MALPQIDRWSSRVPDGYAAVPVTPAVSPLQICVLVSRESDPVTGHLVLLRDGVGTRSLLGCICDAAMRVWQWVEICVQDLEGLSAPLMGLNLIRESLTNRTIDDRWRTELERSDDAELGSVIRTGWEADGPGPIYLDTKSMRAVIPDLSLCRDDALLARRQLPLYSSTLHRYLYQPAKGEESPFWPVTAGAPTNEQTRDLHSIFPPNLLPLNPTGGPIIVRSFSSISLSDLILQLGGAADDSKLFGGWMFMDRRGHAGRFAEAFHLKISLLLEMVIAVRSLVHRTQRPLLNLRSESFQITCDGGPHSASAGLPVLWTCRPRLVDPGDAVTLSIPFIPLPYFLPARREGLSIYQPASVRAITTGRGQLIVRKYSLSADGIGSLEGTFHSLDYVPGGKNDLICFRLNLAGRRVDLYANLQARQNIADGELPFAAANLRFDEPISAALKSAEGVLMHEVAFEAIPLLSSPCDLYSIGILAVQLLLSGPDTTLAECISNLLSLGRTLARTYDSTAPLQLRIQAAFADETRFQETLGPQRLIAGLLTPEAAAKLLPEELWWDTLATVIAMFPGLGPDSIASSLGLPDETGSIHRVFCPSIAALTSLVARSRSLLMVDWTYNREVNTVLRKLRNDSLHPQQNRA